MRPEGRDPRGARGEAPGYGELELTWPGKFGADGSRSRPSREVQPLHLIERFPGPTGESANRLVAGDNLRALPGLLAEFAGRVDLVYLDPPFGTGDAFRIRSPRAGPSGTSGTHQRAGAAFAPRARARGEPIAFADREPGGLGGFIAMLAPRLELIRDLLTPTGSLYLHLDARSVHAAKLLCDEIFGASNFRNHLTWIYAGRRARSPTLQRQARRHPLLHPRPALDVPPRADPRPAPGRARAGRCPATWTMRDTRT